jgi:hypothetical protein
MFRNGSAEIFAEGTAYITTKRDVHRAGLARCRQGVVGGWWGCLGWMRDARWRPLPRGTGLPLPEHHNSNRGLIFFSAASPNARSRSGSIYVLLIYACH